MFEAKALLKAQQTLFTFPENLQSVRYQNQIGPATASDAASGVQEKHSKLPAFVPASQATRLEILEINIEY
jgi:hypothetical protein